MSIKQKIILSNIAMIIIPIIVASIVTIVGLNTVISKYWYSLEEMFENENGITSAQSIIYAYQEELWNTNWAHEKEEELDPDDIKANRKMNSMEEQLSEMGYNIKVSINKKTLYSTLNKRDKDIINENIEEINRVRTLTLGAGDSSVIKYTFFEKKNMCEILAVNTGRAYAHRNGSYLEKYVINFFVIFILILLVTIVVTNMILSRIITNQILPPLKKLSEGSRRIREGDLEEKISYNKKDEFGQVCDDFDQMRIHLKQAVLERLRYEEQRKELISGISHDLRTPLTSIKGYTEGLIDGIAGTDEMRLKYYEAIKIRAGDMERLINRLSEYSKTFDARVDYTFSNTDMQQFITDYCNSNAEEMALMKINVHFTAADEKLSSEIDKLEFKRVFDNLMINTIKYRKKDCSEVIIELRRSGSNALIIFSDDGPGVEENKLDKIFDSFYRGDSSRTNSDEGSGLGLAIVKEIIRKHNGKVRAFNSNGLTVEIKIPLTE